MSALKWLAAMCAAAFALIIFIGGTLLLYITGALLAVLGMFGSLVLLIRACLEQDANDDSG
jgi:hypothetical protein